MVDERKHYEMFWYARAQARYAIKNSLGKPEWKDEKRDLKKGYDKG